MKKLSFLALLFFGFILNSNAQCTLVSAGCGYSVTMAFQPRSIIPSTTVCPSGYNYNVRFTYTITVRGVNTCYNNNIGIQPQFICSGQNNGYYTINVAAPTVGASAINTSYTGTLVTTTNPSRTTPDCAVATPSLLGCNSMQVTIFGPGFPTATYTCGISTLPIELVAFAGKCENNQTLLNWTTAMERNNSFFTIEKSTDAFDWKVVENIRGEAASNKQKHYSYTDKDSKSGTIYYRLKQTDNDLQYTYSDIITVKNCGNSKSNVIIYPNPAEDVIYLSAEGNEIIHSIEVINPVGEIVYSAENMPSQIDIKNLAGGIYFVKYKSGAVTEMKKVMIRK